MARFIRPGAAQLKNIDAATGGLYGSLTPPKKIPRLEPVLPRGNVSRNDPCPCGSGKKYKTCCRGKRQTR